MEIGTGLAVRKESPGFRFAASTSKWDVMKIPVIEVYLCCLPSKGLYGSVPMVLARSKRQPLLACFWNNASDTYVDVASHRGAENSPFTEEQVGERHENVHFISEAGIVDLFVMLGPTPDEVYRQYAVLTGFPALPPIFALGLHQSRWNYFSEDEVVEVDFG